MIPYNAYVGYLKFLIDISHPHKLLCHAKVCMVSSMDNKIHVCSSIDGFYQQFRLVIPSLCVADVDYPDGILISAVAFNEWDVLCIDSFRTFNSPVIWMVIHQITGSNTYSTYYPNNSNSVHSLHGGKITSLTMIIPYLFLL